ncbi:glutathione S-transferase family protein [Congregibacter litoralis]|nr:glutathione S-transferase family protein [Congregibacter litoralis]
MEKIKLYGLRISYYTGKMEAYLRYKGIEHDFVTLNRARFRRIEEKTGTAQMPAIELPDGRFMADTTPMIAWFESQYPDTPVVPEDPVLAFLAHLLEDYFEEWLWRPAMHYRWSYQPSRLHLSRKIVDEFMTDMPVPKMIMRAVIRRRQLGRYVKKDGVSSDTWDHVESIYLKTLERLENVLSQREYLLGDKPSLADFGLFASMFRHFSQDPTASDIMRLQAPGVFEWQARLWNARWNSTSRWLDAVPGDLMPILKDVGAAYLPYLNDNARAWQQRQERFNPTTLGVQYRDVPVSQYRVWCLEELQRKARAVPQVDQDRLQTTLESANCWAPLFELKEPASGYDDSDLPFRAGKVHYDNRR